MSTTTDMKSIVLAVGAKHPKLVKQVFKDRDWLWIAGDYKDFPTIRETLKDLGFRFSRNGHEVEQHGVTAHWYHPCGTIKSSGKKRRRSTSRTVTTVTADEPETAATTEPSPDLYAHDVDAEFDAMFA